jgi:hypothetical protein
MTLAGCAGVEVVVDGHSVDRVLVKVLETEDVVEVVPPGTLVLVRVELEADVEVVVSVD